jgi:hypothetical protein
MSLRFDHLLLRLKEDQHSWLIAAYRADHSFKIVAVLDEPITLELAREITRLIASRLGVSEVREDGL